MKPNNVKTSQWLKYNFLFLSEHFLGEKWYNKIWGNTEKKLYKEIDEYATAHPAKDDFQILEYTKGNYPEPRCHPYFPIVYRGIANDWPSAKKWSFDFFADKFGDQDVTLINTTGLVKDSDEAMDVVKMRDYIDRMRSGSKDYLKFSRIVDEQSTLREDFDYEWLKKFRPSSAMNDLFYFFMGGKSTVTPIHNGFAITIFVQIEGQKKWVFYPTGSRLFLGVRPRRLNYFYSGVDPYKYDDPQYPLIKLAERHEVTLNPGDVLYFPPLVWHQVENVTDSIGVAYKFASIPPAFTSSKMLAACFFMATKPWLIETMLPWRGDVHDYKKKSI
jgi:hypothetical protein